MESRSLVLFLALLSFAVCNAAPEPHRSTAPVISFTGPPNKCPAAPSRCARAHWTSRRRRLHHLASRKITAPVEITYEATVVMAGGAHDRLSDLNCFWMAVDPRAVDTPPFAPTHARTGKFPDYDSLFTYYVGYGGNKNATTRFRRYDGSSERPLLPEHDLNANKFLLAPNHTYRIRLVARDGIASIGATAKKIFTFRDPAPLTSGWFAIRTVRSHLVIRNLRITPLR